MRNRHVVRFMCRTQASKVLGSILKNIDKRTSGPLTGQPLVNQTYKSFMLLIQAACTLEVIFIPNFFSRDTFVSFSSLKHIIDSILP